MTHSRRKILELSLVASALQFIGLSRSPRPAFAAAPNELTQQLVRIHKASSSAQAIGRAYLSLAPEECDTARLLASIYPPDSGNRDCAAELDQDTLREHLMDQHKQDFRDGRTVRIKGWVLSRTEARLCALAAIHA